MVEGFSDMQCKLRSIHLPFSPIATHRTSFYYSVRTYTKHRDQDKDGRHNAMGTCLHNILVLDRDCGALHWCSLSIRSSVGSASEPRGIKLKDAFIHISNLRGRNHHGL